MMTSVASRMTVPQARITRAVPAAAALVPATRVAGLRAASSSR